MVEEASKRPEGTARIVLSGAFLGLSDDPVATYQHHFVHVLERNLDTYDSAVTALDLACGNGGGTLTLLGKLPKGSRVIAVGEDRGELKLFHDQIPRDLRHHVFPRKEKRDRLPFAHRVFDVAWASLANEQLKPARAVVRSALRVLRPGGLLLMAVPLRATFSELVRTIGPSLNGFKHNPAFPALMSEPPELMGAEAWSADFRRCGAVEVEVQSETIEITLAPPLSRQTLFTKHLLPISIGTDGPMQSQALYLLDDAVKESFSVAVHIGCVRGRRGMSDIEDSIVPTCA